MKNNRRNFIKNTLGLSAFAALAPVASMASETVENLDSSESTSSIFRNLDFETQPYLQNLSPTSVTIMWLLNYPAYSYIEFGETKSLEQKAQVIKDGMVEANNTLNKITLTDLKPNTKYYYRAVSKEIRKYKPYDIEFKDPKSTEIFSFTTPNPKSTEVSMVMMNDLHNNSSSIKHLIQYANLNETDFVYLNGDILSHVDSEKQVVSDLLKVCSDTFATETPYFFARGNHEVRGSYARDLKKYIDTPNGNYYYDFVWGATHFTVLDTGEDKEDNHPVFAGLVDFDGYRKEQLKWFKEKVITSKGFKEAKFRVVMMHIPFLYSDNWYTTLQLRDMYAELFNEVGIDVCLSGHTHEYKLKEPSTSEGIKHNYAIVIGGGPSKKARTLTKFKANDKNLEISMLDTDGNEIEHYSVESNK